MKFIVQKKLLLLLLLTTISSSSFANIASWRLLKRLDYKLYEARNRSAEKTARRHRLALSKFTKIDITDPPIYRLIAPDGSQHHILGTMHTSKLSLSDFPTDSKLFPILEQANILIPERVIERFSSEFRFYYQLNIKHRLPKLSKMLTRSNKAKIEQPKLSEQLGEEHWQKLTQIIAEKPDLKPFEQSLDKFMQKIDRSTADTIFRLLVKSGREYVSPFDHKLNMDVQLMRYGKEHGKTLIGLEDIKQVVSVHEAMGKALRQAYRQDISADVYYLKWLIDKGGIDFVGDTVNYSMHLYTKGKLEESKKWSYLFTRKEVQTVRDEFLLDRRNIAWVESGKIQTNCVHGKKCLIFVGFWHLEEGDNALIKLLQKQGYSIDRI